MTELPWKIYANLRDGSVKELEFFVDGCISDCLREAVNRVVEMFDPMSIRVVCGTAIVTEHNSEDEPFSRECIERICSQRNPR